MKFGQYFLIISFLGIIFGLGGYTFILKDRVHSPTEYRALTQEPYKDLGLLRSGEYFTQYETYFSDQFAFRDQWVNSYIKVQIQSNKTFVKNYHIKDDGYILPHPITTTPVGDLNESAKQLNILGELTKKTGSSLYYAPVPSKVNMVTHLFPAFVPESVGESNKQFLLSQLQPYIKYIDMKDQFLHVGGENPEAFYYKTDHHWNEKGAFLAYQLIIDAIRKEFPSITKDTDSANYTYSCLEGYNFSGSYNRQLFNAVDLQTDKVCYYNPKNYSFSDYQTYNGPITKENLVPYTDIYGQALVNNTGSIMYGSAYTWDLGEFNIVNPNSDNNLNVLILKDSYANASVFHLAHHFKTTTIVDTRFNKEITAKELIETNNYDIVLVFYNDSNLTGSMYIWDQLPN